jgi:UPF0755 protein
MISPMASAPPQRMRRALTLGAAVVVAALFAVGLWAALTAPPQPGSHRLEVFRVRPGDSATAIGGRLAAAGLIRSPLAFRMAVEWEHVADRIRAGEYRLSPGMSLASVVATLGSGHILTARLVIPEGATVSEIAARLVASGLGTPKTVAAALAAGLPGITAPPAVRQPDEGFLYPDTYLVPLGTPPRNVLLLMFDNFERRTAALQRELPAHHLTLWQWVTLASIVQAEDAAPREAPRIAAVFLNRLRRHMPLQSDATVRYALGKPVDAVTLHDLATPSPYNTYRHGGLPPGPIDSPGLTALRAVLAPAPVPYLFFVAGPNGQVLYATTYRQHLVNIAKVTAMAKTTRP